MTRQLGDHRAGRGLFIVFEGLDGSGTTTQARLLNTRLAAQGISVEQTFEPSSGPIGGLARSVVDGRLTVDPSALALLFAADRVDHLYHPTNGLVGRLERGTTVVSDRYVLSSLAYQAAQGLSVQWLEHINDAAVVPDVTVYVATDVEICLERIAQRGNRAELFHSGDDLRRIETAYRDVLASDGFVGALLTVDGNQDQAAVASQVHSGLIAIADRWPGSALDSLSR